MSKTKLIVISIVVFLAAIWMGVGIATSQTETLMWVIGGATIIICAMLGPKVWLLIPFLSALSLSFPLPGSPSTQFIAQILVVAFSCLMIMSRSPRYKLQFGALEIWICVLILFVGQAYLRNPVGLNIFGGDSVGAKPYVLFIVAVGSGLVLAWMKAPLKEARMIIWLSITGGIINLGLSIIGSIFPMMGFYLGTSSMRELTQSDMLESEQSTRIGFMGNFGRNLSLWISCFKSPLMACFHILWAPLVLLAFASAGISGFRNVIVAVGLTFIVGIYYRGGWRQVMASLGFLVLGLSLVSVLNTIVPLPTNIQRSLSFLPGTWDKNQVIEAEGSTEWRVEIWEEVLFTDRWIKNKWLGDGLGFSRAELEYQMQIQSDIDIGGGILGASGFDLHRESLLANGDYHSGPVQTIRVIGYIGLTFLIVFMFRIAMYAHRFIRMTKGTEWFPIALFVGIPLIWSPIFFIFVFGTFEMGATSTILGAGFIKLLHNSFDEWNSDRNALMS